MPKLILQFDTEAERQQAGVAVHAMQLHRVISELDEVLRRKLKYEDRSEEQNEALSMVREALWDTVREAGIEHLFYS